MSTHQPFALFLFYVGLASAILPSAVRAEAPPSDASSAFVRVQGTGFIKNGKPYRFMGANFWQAAFLEPDQLRRELDRLVALGVRNVRIWASSEGPDTEPWRVTPAAQPAPGQAREAFLGRLGSLLQELRKRDMDAVLVLNNFWSWSGGMAQYVSWATGQSIPYPPPAPGGDWGRFMDFSALFYVTPKALELSNDWIRQVVPRFREEPALFAWELANEPRGMKEIRAFNAWIDSTSRLIRGLDPYHLITTGSEGQTPDPKSSGLDLEENHRYPAIDYATLHVWAQNWGWFDPQNPLVTLTPSIQKAKAYVRDHAARAQRLGKPLIIEEFGLARDRESLDPASRTRYRDLFYREVFEETLQLARQGSPVAGVNFWAWSGEARPSLPLGTPWRSGDALLGDPPHEPQGWYGVYESDKTTLDIIHEFAEKLSAL